MLLGAVLLLLAYALGLWIATPDVTELLHRDPRRTSYMRHRAAELHLPDTVYAAQWVPLDRLSPLLVCAVVKAEDRGFFRHRGFEWEAIRAAFRRTLRGQRGGSGSTITQQLARNLYLAPERSLHRKLREALITRELENTLTKRRILELYLNTTEWGEGVWGAGAASRHYFAKDPARLDAFESSFLASLLAAPRHPLAGPNAARARRVQRRVLNQLARSRLLNPDELRMARSRAAVVHTALEARAPLPHVLVVSAQTQSGAPRWRVPRTRRTVAQVLADECGLERELRNERR